MMHRRNFMSMLTSFPLLMSNAWAQEAKAKHLLVVFCRGGWDVTMVFDPHFSSSAVDSPQDAQERESSGLRFASSNLRPSVDSFFSQYAAQSVIVNGIAVGSISHSKCEQLLFCGSRAATASDLPSMIASTKDRLLPAVVLSGPRFPGQLSSIVTPVDALFSQLLQEQDASDLLIHEFLLSQAQGEGRLAQEYRKSLSRKKELSDFRDLLNIEEDPSLYTQLELATDLFAQGLSSCATVEMDLPQRVGWDSHIDNHGNQSQCFEHLFSRLHTLMELLESKVDSSGSALIDNTVVAVLSEMGRTPKYNSSSGKDHWPYTSAMLISKALQGGRVLGASNDQLIGGPVDFVTGRSFADGMVLSADSFLAGILKGFGVDTEIFFPQVPSFDAPFI